MTREDAKKNVRVFLFFAGVTFALFIVRYLVSFFVINYGWLMGIDVRNHDFIRFYYEEGQKVFSLQTMWLRWDASVYKDIALRGYEWAGEETFKYSRHGWFPLYSYTVGMLVRILPFYNLEAWVVYAGVFLSNFSFALSLFVLYLICKELNVSQKAMKLFFAIFILYPWNYFFTLFYSESFYLLLTSLCFYFLLKGWYLYAVIFCALSLATRPTSLSLAITVALWIFYKDWLAGSFLKLKILLKICAKYLIYFLIGVTPVFIYFSHMKVITGDSFAVTKWHNIRNHNPRPFRIFIRWYEENPFDMRWGSVFNLVLLILSFYWLGKNWRLIRSPYTLVYLSAFLYTFLLSSNGTPDSLTRYMGVNFALFMLYAIYGSLGKMGGCKLGVVLAIMFLLQNIFLAFHVGGVAFYSF